jgi:hypothetical protein
MTDTRIGDWMQTFSGRRFYPIDPRPAEVDFRDIAHALAHICRYGGHSRRFYSVAEHCSGGAGYFIRMGRPDLARWFLLHDGSEAYVGDIIRPVKPSLEGYGAIELEVQRAIYFRAELIGEDWNGAIPEEVKEVDNRILADEARRLFGEAAMRNTGWPVLGEPLGINIACQLPEQAERQFLDLFRLLFQRDPAS